MKLENMLLAVIWTIGCAKGTVAPAREPWPWEDEPETWDPEPHPCQEDFVDIDFWNCGETCEDAVACSTADTDNCTDGMCMCGDFNACPSGSDCRFGFCVSSDPDGAFCEFDEECVGYPDYQCIERQCTFVECLPEDCNGRDDDCDGKVDENAKGAPLSRWCYNGLIGDEIGEVLEPCLKGVQYCTSEGSWSECIGEELPRVEQGVFACDDIDNDCDGCADGLWKGGYCLPRESPGFDIVFGIDTSGSMSDEIDAVKIATSDFSETFSESPDFRFALVAIPARGEVRSAPGVISDLTDFDSFVVALDTFAPTGDGNEPQWDAVYELGTGELPLSWGEETTRIIIIFTDENGQSYRHYRGLADITEADMCGALTHGEVLAFVVVPKFRADFDDCAHFMFDLSSDAAAMVEQLEEIIADPCA